jgi:hypothetical protein
MAKKNIPDAVISKLPEGVGLLAPAGWKPPPACPRCWSDLPSDLPGTLFTCPVCELVVRLPGEEKWIEPAPSNLARVVVFRF